MKQNRPLPNFIRLRTDNKIRYNSKRRYVPPSCIRRDALPLILLSPFLLPQSLEKNQDWFVNCRWNARIKCALVLWFRFRLLARKPQYEKECLPLYFTSALARTNELVNRHLKLLSPNGLIRFVERILEHKVAKERVNLIQEAIQSLGIDVVMRHNVKLEPGRRLQAAQPKGIRLNLLNAAAVGHGRQLAGNGMEPVKG